MGPDVSIVVPCYNEEPHLRASVAEIRNVMRNTRYTYEIIFVDDCSRDRTQAIIRRICAEDPLTCRFIMHKRNLGRGGSVCDGLLAARGRVAGFLDIDLEVHARYIPSAISAVDDGSCDVATVLRIYRTDLNPRELLRTVLSVCYRQLVRRSLGLPFKDTESGFKFFERRRILPLLGQARDQGWFWDTEIMALAYFQGLAVREIPGLFLRRKDKVSSVKILQDSLAYLQALRLFQKRMQSPCTHPSTGTQNSIRPSSD